MADKPVSEMLLFSVDNEEVMLLRACHPQLSCFSLAYVQAGEGLLPGLTDLAPAGQTLGAGGVASHWTAVVDPDGNIQTPPFLAVKIWYDYRPGIAPDQKFSLGPVAVDWLCDVLMRQGFGIGVGEIAAEWPLDDASRKVIAQYVVVANAWLDRHHLTPAKLAAAEGGLPAL